MSDSHITHDRIRSSGQNIEQIRESVTGVRVEAARQTERMRSIKDVLAAMDVNMTRIDGTLRRIDQNMSNMQQDMTQLEVALQVNTNSLREHMRRTEELENPMKDVHKFRWQATGIVVVITIVASYLAKLLPGLN